MSRDNCEYHDCIVCEDQRKKIAKLEAELAEAKAGNCPIHGEDCLHCSEACRLNTELLEKQLKAAISRAESLKIRLDTEFRITSGLKSWSQELESTLAAKEKELETWKGIYHKTNIEAVNLLNKVAAQSALISEMREFVEAFLDSESKVDMLDRRPGISQLARQALARLSANPPESPPVSLPESSGAKDGEKR